VSECVSECVCVSEWVGGWVSEKSPLAASVKKFSFLWYVSSGDLSWKIISEWKPSGDQE